MPSKTKTSIFSKGLSVLAAFHGRNAPLGVSEIARRTKLPKSTTYRLIEALRDDGYLERVAGGSNVMLTDRYAELGDAFVRQSPHLQDALQFMQKFANHHNVSVGLGEFYLNQIVYVQYCSCPATSTLKVRVGSVIPLLESAIGKSYLMTQSSMAATNKICALTNSKRSDSSRIYQDILACYKEKGFVTSPKHWASEVHAVGAPVGATKVSDGMGLSCVMRSKGVERSQYESRMGPPIAQLANDLTTVFKKALPPSPKDENH